MHWSLVMGPWRLLALAGCAVGALALLGRPLVRPTADDRGDGNALVLLPPPRLPALWQGPLLVTVFVLLLLLYHAVDRTLGPDQLYADAVRRLVSGVVKAPAEVDGYLGGFTLGLRAGVVGSMVSLAVVGRGGPARRALMVLQAAWYLAAMVVVDALLVVVAVVFAVPVGPTTLLGNLLALGVAFVGMARFVFTGYCLPRPSAVPFAPRPRLSDAATLVGCTVASMAVAATVVVLLFEVADPRWRPLLTVVLPVPFAALTTVVRSVLLVSTTWLSRPPAPEVGDERPPIDVIIPAYNESEVIEDTLRAIDRAAGRYGGPVHVVLTDDGSGDGTGALARETMDGFRFASGRVVQGRHGGKSAALNTALAETTADIVIRIDADTLIEEPAFVPVPRWFRDPGVGLVEAMMFPRWRPTPLCRMRLFEELKMVGLLHRTLQWVDGVNVVPGVFTAFRRRVALQLGGFTVGMNGEDGDFTLRHGRLGYRTVMDPTVVVREDVPPTFLEIREQRVRWDRATIHNHARHGPTRAGIGTPQSWFSQTHQFYAKMFAPIRLTLPFFVAVTAAFDGAGTTPVVLFFGSWLAVSAGFAAIELGLTLGYGQLRRAPWVLLWPLWQVCLSLFSTEALLSLPGRPAGLWGARPQAVTEAVVH